MFKKGDKVYSILRGWGEVTGTVRSNKYSLEVAFGSHIFFYTKDGKAYNIDLHPELYHTEPVITVPKRRVEHTGWIAISNDKNGLDYASCSHIHSNETSCRKSYGEIEGYTIQQITYYTEE